MGIETTALALIASTVIGAGTAGLQAAQANKSAKQQKRANNIKTNQEKNEQLLSTRQAVRDRRIRAAALESQSEASGTQGSSGELGALSGLSGDLNSAIGRSSGRNNAADGINAANQKSADALQNSRDIGAVGGIFQTVAAGAGKTNGFKSIFS